MNAWIECRSRRTVGIVSLLLVLSMSGSAAASAQDDLKPLKSAAPDGLGPLSLPYLNNVLAGAAFVYGGGQPDLFVIGRGRTQGLFLCRWLRTAADGAPVFAPPERILHAPKEPKGTVLQTPDGEIHGLWLDKKNLIHTRFDREHMAFRPITRISLSALPSTPQNLAAFLNPDGSVDVAFELTGETVPARHSETNASSEQWTPYDAAGISNSEFRYRYLFGARFPGMLTGPPEDLRQLSGSKREVYFGMMQLAAMVPGPDSPRAVLAGSRQGIFSIYESKSGDRLDLRPRVYAAGADGRMLRHPSISASVCAYPRPDGSGSDFLAAGEGAVFFYRSSGRTLPNGNPVFADPIPVLQEDAELYAGTLPTPSAIDWDGDGVTDLIVGNSEGFVLFFKNIGTDENPAFLPGVRVQAGGRDIQVQAGYRGSIQGTPEARWGYLSPTAFDWNRDGLPDLLTGDVTGGYHVYINRGTKSEPALDAAHPIYCDGLELHGMWRSRPALAHLGDETALVIVDGDDHLHLYWRIDDYNVRDGGKLHLDDGTLIEISADPGGGTGRCKLDFYDADGDGLPDLVIGTGRRSAIPNMETGYPLPVLGKRTLGTPLLMRNTGTLTQPVFEHPQAFKHRVAGLLQPGGSHETGAIGTRLGGGSSMNLVIANEAGRLFLIRGENLAPMSHEEAATYRDRPNPLPASNPDHGIQ